jgi:hypothetical protein
MTSTNHALDALWNKCSRISRSFGWDRSAITDRRHVHSRERPGGESIISPLPRKTSNLEKGNVREGGIPLRMISMCRQSYSVGVHMQEGAYVQANEMWST